MRIEVDVGDVQLRELDALSKKEKRSRAVLIREAVDEYLAKRRKKLEGDAFGLWGKRKMDGLAYQAKVRRALRFVMPRACGASSNRKRRWLLDRPPTRATTP